MKSLIGILGAGNQAVETTQYIILLGNKPAFYFEESNKGRALVKSMLEQNVKVVNELDGLKCDGMVTAVGSPALRRSISKLVKEGKFVNVMMSNVKITGVKIGIDVTIGPGCVIGPYVDIGNHVLINVGTTISHNCKIGNFVTVSPGVNIAGDVEIKDGVYVGIGVTIINNVRIGAGAVVGAGSVVCESVEAGSVVCGVPAKRIKPSNV